VATIPILRAAIASLTPLPLPFLGMRIGQGARFAGIGTRSRRCVWKRSSSVRSLDCRTVPFTKWFRLAQ
jgi:hypothetical protein